MNIHPIMKSDFRPAFSGRQTSFIELLHRNYTTNAKSISNQIISAGTKTAVLGHKITYTISPTVTKSQTSAANVKGYMQVIIDRSKKLISNIKIFSYNNPKYCLEDIIYTYNRKGQIIKVQKQTRSPNNIIEKIKTNVKYGQNNITITKDINNSSEKIKTIITTIDDKKVIEKSSKKNENIIEHFKYKEGETLYSKSEYENSNIIFEAYGDTATGEMVFSKSTINPLNAGEYIEQLSNGNYIKQTLLKNGDIITKEIPPSIADNFIHQKKDLITPQNEIITKLEEFGIYL